MTTDISCKIWGFFGRVIKRVESRMQSSGISGFWDNFELTIHQTLVNAISGSKHQLVGAQPHRRSIAVRRSMLDSKNGHWLVSTLTLLFSEPRRCLTVRHIACIFGTA
jgi:hypothetical protein